LNLQHDAPPSPEALMTECVLHVPFVAVIPLEQKQLSVPDAVQPYEALPSDPPPPSDAPAPEELEQADVANASAMTTSVRLIVTRAYARGRLCVSGGQRCR
jgi:hypothetical protein